MVSTAKDTLATDNGQPPDHDLGMAVYLDEWMTFKKARNADLARYLNCDRSLVGMWRKRKRALTNVNWINGICEFLEITQEQLAQKPPKSLTSVRVSKGFESDTVLSAKGAESTEVIEMVIKRTDLHAAIEELPDDLIDTAVNLINRLKGARGPKPPHPSRRGSTKA
jgi:DNA-binding Xre family transcriptional regulator